MPADGLPLIKINNVRVIFLLGLSLCAQVQAQIVTDGTVGPAQNLTGPNYTIPESLGTRSGANLFHSFSDFNINTGESADFTSGFAGVTDHVISRVTGINPSNIDGLLRNSIPGSDFWFMNPNGVLFGPNAALDVPGSFHVTTADFLLLGQCEAAPVDCGRFDAGNPGDSVLTFTPPSVYGFVDNDIGSISVTGNPGSPVTLQVPDGETFSFVGQLGSVDASDGSLTDAFQDAQLVAREGRIDLVSAQSVTANETGRVSADHATDAPPVIDGFSSAGAIGLTNSRVIVKWLQCKRRAYLFARWPD